MFAFLSHLKLRTKLVILLLFFGLLPVAAIMPIVSNGLSGVKDSILRSQETTAEAINDTIDRNLFERYGDVQAFGLNAAVKNPANWRNVVEGNTLISAINGYMTNYGLYKLMVVVDLQGNTLAVNSVDPKGNALDTAKIYNMNFSKEEWFKNAVGKKFLEGNGLTGTYVDQPHYNALVAETYKEDGFSLIFSAPVYDDQGKMIGVWGNFVDFGLVEEIVAKFYEQKKAQQLASTEITLLDNKGNMIVDFDPEEFEGAYKRDSKVIGHENLAQAHYAPAVEVAKGTTGSMIATDPRHPISQAVSYAKSKGAYSYPGLGWAAMVRIPEEFAFESVLSLNKTLYTVLAVAFGIILASGIAIGTMAVKPLRQSTHILQNLAAGDYSVDITGDTRGDELGDIARAQLELRKAVEKSIRLQTMIDNLSVPVLLCDKQFTIIYANRASLDTLKRIEKYLAVPADKIVGASLDSFQHDSQQRGALTDESKLPYQTRFRIGDEWLYLNANILKDRNGTFSGSFVDWRVITEETKNEEMVKLAQEKIQELIVAANDGVLDKRLDASEFVGFYANLAQSMNGLMDTIVEPLKSAIDTLKNFSEGDLTRAMTGEFKGSFGEIQTALNSTITRLRDIVVRIKQAAESVNVASSEISDGSSNLSSRTEQQASSLEETAASMEEITSTVRQNSENAKNANTLSAEAREIAENGGKVVDDAVAAMANIEKSSQKISDIISVIDEIAFQTNLLALNAAVEAARAGEAGKGFAVVASEVRSLAGRSASASKEIKALINESSQQVKTGATLVNQAGTTLKDIVASVKKVADIIAEIATASQEQSTGIDETSTAIAQMDEMTQQNAALVEQNTAAAQSLVNQAAELDQMMQFFTVSSDQRKTAETYVEEAQIARAAATHSAPRRSTKTNGSANGAANGKAPPKLVAAKAQANGKHYDREWEEF